MSIIYPGAYTTNRLLSPIRYYENEYALVMAVSKESRIPIINAQHSMGPFVRQLIEHEKPGVKLLAYSTSLTLGTIMNMWNETSGKETKFIRMSWQAMHEEMGLKYEFLDPVSQVAETGYAAGFDWIIEPSQLNRDIETKSYEDWLKGQDWSKKP